MTKYTVIGGPASQDLARKIAKKLHAKYLGVEHRVFPDGESKITVKGRVREGKVIVVQSTPPPVDSNLIMALLLVSKAREMSSSVYAVIPYLGYARQDKEFLPGEFATISLVASMLISAGATKLICVDVHSLLAFNYFRIPKKNLSAVPLLAKYFQKLKLHDPIVVAPDLFWKEKAKEFSKILKANHMALNKQRDRKTGKLTIKLTRKDMKGRDVIFLDDMVSSGGSIVTAVEFLKRKRMGKIYVACTHAVLAGDAEKRLRKIGVTKIVSSNTIDGKTNHVDVSEMIANTIKKW